MTPSQRRVPGACALPKRDYVRTSAEGRIASSDAGLRTFSRGVIVLPRRRGRERGATFARLIQSTLNYSTAAAHVVGDGFGTESVRSAVHSRGALR
jgi:hypothetical protein